MAACEPRAAQLPVVGGHSGGHLCVRHGGEEQAWATNAAADDAQQEDGDQALLRYSAFYADCEHELKPVARGLRVVLVSRRGRCSCTCHVLPGLIK
jgi:hypothetical protein